MLKKKWGICDGIIFGIERFSKVAGSVIKAMNFKQ